MKTIVFSVDVEPDLEPFAGGTAFGIVEGLPPVFELLDKLGVPAHFFFLGSITQSHSWAVREAATHGHGIGSHGWDHDLLCRKVLGKQISDIDKATDAIQSVCGIRPRSFRAANFSISGAALQHLENRGYIVDSSVMPGRVARRWRILPIYDYRKAARGPYHPSSDNPVLPGNVKLVEFPLATNQERPGTPVGSGYVNAFGVEKMLETIRNQPTDVVVLLAHSWEFINLRERIDGLPEGYARGCSSDLSSLESVLIDLQSKAKFSTLELVAQEWLENRKLDQQSF